MTDFPLMFVLFAVMVVAVFVIAVVFRNAERKRWAEFAAARGWQHSVSERAFFKGLRAEPFGRGSSRRAHNIVSGNWQGLPVLAFGYTYTTGSGDDRTTHHHGVVQFASDATLPRLEVQSGFRLRLTKDIQFESEDFNRRFDVRADDERFAFQIVHPRFMTALLDGGLEPYNYSIEDGVFTIWQKGRMRIDRVDDMLSRLVDLVEQVPPHVWADSRVTAPAITSGREHRG